MGDRFEVTFHRDGKVSLEHHERTPMNDQTRHKLSAALYAAVPLATVLAADAGLGAERWQSILAAVTAFLMIFGINLRTGDGTAAVGGAKDAAE